MSENESQAPAPSMSLRNYFAAHAPEVPEWFQPVMPPQPEVLEVWTYFTSPEQQGWLKFFYSGGETQKGQWPFNEPGSGIPQSFKDEVSAFLVQIDQRWKEIYEWETQEQIQRIIQWRFYYADNMVAGALK